MTRTLHLAEQLIARPSITPDDAGCLDLLAARLAPLGFVCERMDSGPARQRVSNLWAKRPVAQGPDAHDASKTAVKTIVFAGHTDVVPTGPLEQWSSNPFSPTRRDGRLYGGGPCDRKTLIAAFIVALEEFLAATRAPRIALALLLTSDEESPSVNGTLDIIKKHKSRNNSLY